MSYERRSVQDTQAYQPGKQAALSETIKLNTNENPYPPPAEVVEALRSISAETLRRYPPPLADAFRSAVAELHRVDVESIIAVNGGDELIRLAMATFVEPGQPVGILQPSYALYPVVTSLHGSPIIGVELDSNWLPPDDAASLLNAAGAALVFMTNPHAPSGSLVSVEEIERFAGAVDGVVLIDEAYVDFVDPSLEHDAVTLIRRLDNVILLRTLSKGYSLAGLRCGYGIGSRGVIRPMLTKTRDAYNVDAIAQRVAECAVRQRAAAEQTWHKVRQSRAALTEALVHAGFRVYPSQTNFVLATVPPERDAALMTAQLEQRGILVRHFDAPRLRDKLRITVGTPEQNAALLLALRELV
ncbi:MAG TPA: histidinol-phosphate transaminase [Polyangiaceae bacterium]|nr:histidinol-phosphate transaminase [Polyangiaceae bacterium]